MQVSCLVVSEIDMNNPRENEILEKTVAILCESLSPRRIFLFGSRTKKQYPSSADFDIAVDHPRPPFRQVRKILDSLNACAGLHKIDLVYLSDVDEDFRTMILETGRVIYEKPA
jgi:uncharacterized protein